MNAPTRKGARSQKDIPQDILNQLNKGLIESVNLTEWLAIDQIILIHNILQPDYATACEESINGLKNKTVTHNIRTIGEVLLRKTISENDDRLFGKLSPHPSDMARCWAAYIVGLNECITVEEKLERIKPFAADTHFGVREIAWMAIRHETEKHIEKVIRIFTGWAVNSDDNIRRFSCEAIRPNGVWCKHIDRLKTEPELALPILEKLNSDPSKYVQDSVANWLNDASKSKPDFVKNLCRKWAAESTSKSTSYIIKRALRTVNK
ncbi:DNA alkylation repair protein [Dysgonomonas macrotermitis]|uniref:3-methyladenine DNA glycosylase AlkC n=1 Tax=Dysgonomonas macrotermitis TaxID=1346286 RepID=A0A1M5EMY8_9BACT|nr:DNA alkylation repair protein [Dysgonomonas macrotermitis]SHF80653.1 3-methyladenine DNA glycosylase AlkC [Dysgonomonas macrotermitis]